MSKPLWCLLVAASLAAQHQSPADLAGAEAGARIFRHHCSGCHGRNAQGGRAPDLTRGGMSADALFQKISQGVPGTEMLGYRERFSPEDIRRIAAFIMAANRDQSRLTGDAARGETLFWNKVGCGACHAVGARGNRIGADLSRIATKRSIPYLREALLAPGSAITPSFDFVNVVTREGKTIRGVEKARDDFSVIVVDFTGTMYSFDRAALASVKPNPAGHMPGKDLTEPEIQDVLAYLWTLRAPLPALSRDRQEAESSK